jgi:hypothetical protein
VTKPPSLRRLYGAHPVHLLLMLACFALAGFAGTRLLTGDTRGVVVWFVGAALLHDLVLVPLYSGSDLAAQTALGHGTAPAGSVPASDPTPAARANDYINYLRVPGYLSLLLLLVWYPLILRRSQPYEAYTALSLDVYLGRWLLISAVLFAVSAALLGVRAIRRYRRAHPRVRRRRGRRSAPPVR